MSGNIVSAKTEGIEPSPGWVTGYRVSLVPGGLDISARLATAEELHNLLKLLRAGIVFLEKTAEGDMDEALTLTKRVAAVSVAPPK